MEGSGRTRGYWVAKSRVSHPRSDKHAHTHEAKQLTVTAANTKVSKDVEEALQHCVRIRNVYRGRDIPKSTTTRNSIIKYRNC